MDEMVSVIMLAYNHEKWIEKAINSVLKQNTKYSFKIYVHEDCSTDNTRKILKNYAEKYPNIIVPVFAAKNRYSQGIQIITDVLLPLIKGKYIMICECDDYWISDNKLETQIEYMEKNPECKLCFSNAKIIDLNGKYLKDFLPQRIWNDECIYQRLLNDDGCDFSTKEIIILDFIPTASICAKADAFMMIKSFSDGFDLTIRLVCAHEGSYSHYFNRYFTAYRTGNPLSASGAINNSYTLLYKHFYLRHKLAYKEFNRFTNYAYHDAISKMIERKFVIANFVKGHDAIKKLRRYDELSYMTKFKEYIKSKSPTFFKILKQIRYMGTH